MKQFNYGYNLITNFLEDKDDEHVPRYILDELEDIFKEWLKAEGTISLDDLFGFTYSADQPYESIQRYFYDRRKNLRNLIFIHEVFDIKEKNYCSVNEAVTIFIESGMMEKFCRNLKVKTISAGRLKNLYSQNKDIRSTIEYNKKRR